MGISCELSSTPNGWPYGGFIILGFLPKSFPRLLQLTTGAPTLCCSAAAHVVLQLPVSLGAQEARPEPPYLAPLQLIGATVSELTSGKGGSFCFVLGVGWGTMLPTYLTPLTSPNQGA